MRFLLAFAPLVLLAGCSTKSVAPVPAVSVEKVTYRSSKDTASGILFYPVSSKPLPALVMVHGDFGLTEWVKEQARRLAGKGYAVLAVDLYRGRVVNDLLDAHIMDRGLPEDQVLADLKAAVDYLAVRPEVQADRLAIIGCDSGGGYALDAAIQDVRLRAAVVCYGRLTTDPALLASLRAPVLGIFAEKDEGISPATIEQFQTAMRKAGKRIAGIHVYPNCPHGFLEPSSSESSGPPTTEAIADAWNRIETFLAAELNP
jgi:carboxymethylenebutenolidase